MGALIAIMIVVAFLAAIAEVPKSRAPSVPRQTRIYSQVRQGHWERRITGYKLQRNFAYDQLKENWNWSDQHMHRMGFQEYTLRPEYNWVWVSE